MAGTDETIQLARGPLHVALETRPAALEISFQGGPTALRLLPNPPPAFAALLAQGPRAMTRGDLKGLVAPAHRIEWLSFLRHGPGLRFAVEIDAGGAGVTLEMTLENRGTTPIELAPLGVARCAAALPPLGQHLLWSDGAGNEESLLIGKGRGPTLWAGFLTGRTGYGRLTLEPGGFRAESTGAGALAPGASLRIDRLFVGRAEDPASALDAWARRAGAEMEAALPARPVQVARGAGTLAIREARHQPGTAARVWRTELARLRGGLEANAQLSAAGPVLASAGLAHALRPGADALELAATSQRLWLLDLALGRGERGSLAWEDLLAGLIGGVVRLPDPGTDEYTQRLLPPLAREASQLSAGVLRIPLLGDRIAILLCNRSQQTQALGVRLAGLGLDGPVHAYDFGANEPLGLVDEEVPEREVAPGAGRLIALTPPMDRPQVVGSNIHVGMGTAEVAAIRSTRDGFVLILRHAGEHRGDVWITHPGAAHPRRVPVQFRDRAEIPIRSD